MSDMSNGGRVTTREFYDALMGMDRRLGDKIDDITSSLAASEAKFKATEDRIDACYETLTKDIGDNTRSIEKVRNLNTFIALLGSTIAGIIGVQK